MNNEMENAEPRIHITVLAGNCEPEYLADYVAYHRALGNTVTVIPNTSGYTPPAFLCDSTGREIFNSAGDAELTRQYQDKLFEEGAHNPSVVVREKR